MKQSENAGDGTVIDTLSALQELTFNVACELSLLFVRQIAQVAGVVA